MLGKVSYIIRIARHPWPPTVFHMLKATPTQTVGCMTGPDCEGGKLVSSYFLWACLIFTFFSPERMGLLLLMHEPSRARLHSACTYLA